MLEATHDASASLQPEPSPRRRVALIVGVNGQPVPGRDALKFAVDDAKEMAKVLVVATWDIRSHNWSFASV